MISSLNLCLEKISQPDKLQFCSDYEAPSSTTTDDLQADQEPINH